ncbi:hypothetical protein ACVOMV_29340 [Mesorhizobium atlanticum]
MTDVLKTMFNNEVTLEEMFHATGMHFNHCVMTWNSGNFCSLAASNNRENLNLYLSQMAAPAIPNEYAYEASLYRANTDYAATLQKVMLKRYPSRPTEQCGKCTLIGAMRAEHPEHVWPKQI